MNWIEKKKMKVRKGGGGGRGEGAEGDASTVKFIDKQTVRQSWEWERAGAR